MKPSSVPRPPCTTFVFAVLTTKAPIASNGKLPAKLGTVDMYRVYSEQLPSACSPTPPLAAAYVIFAKAFR